MTTTSQVGSPDPSRQASHSQAEARGAQDVDEAPTCKEIQAANEVYALTPIQRIAVCGKAKQLVAFLNTGSNIHLVRKGFEEEAG